MPFKSIKTLALPACLAFAIGAHAGGAAAAAPGPGAATPAAAAENSKDPRAALLKKLPAGAKIEDLRPAPIPGMYEFAEGSEISYVTADGKYFIDGSLYDMDTRQNLTEIRKGQIRVALLAAVPESQMIIFSPKAPQYTITVFTDVDCGYCRKLHSEISEFNRLGVRVRYLAFPRSGPNTDSWTKARVVWCSSNRNDALTRAKLGGALDLSKVCPNDPVRREYELGQSLGVRGTPAIMTETGDYISGYVPPAELVRYLKDLKVARR
jgi:thiol:disulfide interchange protein DsbC